MGCQYRQSSVVMLSLFALIGCLILPDAQASRSKVGVRLGAYTDAQDLFLGVEALTPLAPSLYLNPNLEYVFVDNGAFTTFNFDFHYDFATQPRQFSFWAGAGLGVIYTNPEGPPEGNADLGVDLLFGVGFGPGPTIPYIQSKIILSDNTELVIGFGFRF